ncbi:bacteriophage abortive infection AbiH family protein [Providencia rettgeri]|uniref:bacteriophage abortive infection AbiH family protein n=1 Tax=Proteus vulgaris TaxID=585 RepID=UPI001B35E94B|nr:bacteriophage abortive infection AbiH family protein [Proteus vulgaris]EMB5786680.1 bacteriophage abortive infection AbiH family protein [Providencia rettgeri]MBQ0212373.1 bacteriophage abortive infection AbiH family protein [Proteus vulgaris]
MKLYIIGNGFDLFHGMKTSYNDFKAFVRGADYDVYQAVNDFAPAGDEWNELESSLGDIDFYNIIEECEMYLTPYGADDFKDRDHHTYEFEIERITNNLTSDLLNQFCNWVSKIEVPEGNQYKKFKTIDHDAIFLTFNYTSTLEQLYSINKDNVKHIHGSINDSSSEIILGHGWERTETVNPAPGIDQDTRMSGAYALLDEMFDSNFKNSSEIINQEHVFFNSLSSVTEIVVIGHSLSHVDSRYFEEILNYVPQNTIWRYALRTIEQDQEKTDSLVNLGVKKEHIKNVLLSSL